MDIKILGQDIKNSVVNAELIQNPEQLSKFCQATKVVAVALAVITVAAALFTGPIALIFAALFATCMFDAFKMASNIKEIADSKGAESRPETAFIAQAKLKELESQLQNVCRGTILATFILNCLPKQTAVKA